ncbi:MAG: hypothetical protein WKF37_24540 [Bryobacteraceae bacterium]
MDAGDGREQRDWIVGEAVRVGAIFADIEGGCHSPAAKPPRGSRRSNLAVSSASPRIIPGPRETCPKWTTPAEAQAPNQTASRLHRKMARSALACRSVHMEPAGTDKHPAYIDLLLFFPGKDDKPPP